MCGIDVRTHFRERLRSRDSLIIFNVIGENIRDGLGRVERFCVITPMFEFKVGNFRDCRVNGMCECDRVCFNISFIGTTMFNREILYHPRNFIEFASLEFHFPTFECDLRLITDPK